MSWADCTAPSAARATRQSMRRFSAARSMAGGSAATMPPTVLEYSEEENSRARAEVASGEWRVASEAEEEPAGLADSPCATASEFAPSRRRVKSPGLREANLSTRETSLRKPNTPITGVGGIDLPRVSLFNLPL